MPSRKQRRREAKSKRHEYEFVYVDAEGNELDADEVPEDVLDAKERRNGSKKTAAPAPKGSRPAQRGARRTPPEPSWNRALKRGALLGVVVFVLFSFTAKGNVIAVVPLALLYTLLFIPFTYYIDRFAYRRYLAKQGGASPPAAKKR